MAYKPKNLASFRDDSSKYPKGASAGANSSARVPGTTGSDDRESRVPKADFYNDGQTRRAEDGTFSIMQNEGVNSRTKENFGQASYNYGRPTL